MVVEQRIHCPLLVGIEKDDDYHRGAATMRGTGEIVLFEGYEASNARNWYVEFKCDVCREIIHVMYADLLDVVTQALEAAGIIEAPRTFE